MRTLPECNGADQAATAANDLTSERISRTFSTRKVTMREHPQEASLSGTLER